MLERWGLTAARLACLPVGFGDHRWALTGPAGGEWFVTVTELDDGAQPEADGYADLTGHHVSRAAVHMDRMQQSLDDIGLSLREFRGQHRQTEDTGET